MKRKKFLSILMSFCLIFTFLFVDTAQAMETFKSAPISSVNSVCSGDYMYYTMYDTSTASGGIYKVNIYTKQNTLIKETYSGSFGDLVVKDGWIYYEYIDPGARRYIYKVRTNGKDGKLLKKGYHPVIYNNSIYYIKCLFDELSDNYDPVAPVGIYKMSLSGKNDTCVKKTSTVDNFIIYKTNIYYTTYSDSTNKNYLRKTNLSGSTSKILVSCSGFKISGLKSYSGYIYFNYGKDIYRIKTSSTTKSKFISNAGLNDIYNGYIYYTVRKSYKDYLYKMNISSKTKTYIMKNFCLDVIDIENGYMLMDVATDSNSIDNCYIYLCNTSGNKGKIINYYYVA